MPWSLKKFKIQRVGVVDGGDNPEAEVVLFKSKEKDIKNKGGANMSKTLDELIKGLPEEDAKLINDELKTKNDKIVELEKSQKEPDKKVEPSDEELLKSADPKIKELLEKAQKEAKDTKETVDKLQKEKDEKDAELKKEALSKEAGNYGNIGATKEDLVEIFTKIDKTGDTELLEKVKAVLSADNTALKDSPLMKATGSDKDPEDKKVMDKVEEKAEELRKADPTLTKEKARTRVIKDDPKLYAEYIKE